MVSNVTSELKNKVLSEIKTRCLKRGATFRLASGGISDVYVDSKGITLHAPSLKILSEYFWQVWSAENLCPLSIAGVSVGGDPLATGLALEAYARGIENDILLVRKEKKAHGGSEGRAVEGRASSLLRKPLFLVEDVMSTGGSSAKALHFMKDEGYSVEQMWAIVDRGMGAIDRIKNEFSIPVRSLFHLDELL